MRPLLSLAWASLLNRRLTSLLTVLSISLSVALLIGVERIRQGVRESFGNTVSQTDLIVGARGAPLQILLYAVFHMGDASNNISWKSYEHVRGNPLIDWTIPFSLGDSHRGFRVVATDENFYEHYRYGGDRSIALATGQRPNDVFDVALGAEAAEQLGYKVGDPVVITHGVTDGPGFMQHADKPFHVVATLKRTGTPVDKALYITLEGMEAIHMDWQDGMPPEPGQGTPASKIRKEDIKIGQITSFLLRTKTRVATLRLQRDIDTYEGEPLTAAIPGVALSQLWDTVSYVEGGLRIVSLFVIAVGFMGMLISLYNSLNERRREMAILRALGLGPARVLFLLLLEAGSLTLLSILGGFAFVYLGLWSLRPLLESRWGFFLPLTSPSSLECQFALGVFVGGLAMGLVPALKAYRNSLSDGLAIKV